MPANRKFHFIINPISANTTALERFLEAEKIIAAHGCEYTTAYTRYPGHAHELAKVAIALGEKCIVAVGGDGTVSEVASACANTDVCMGILPFGTGNDLSRSLGISPSSIESIERLLEGTPKVIDAATANGKIFANVSGFGFDVDVLKALNRFRNESTGMSPYLKGVVASLLKLKPFKLKITHDGIVEHISAVLVAVGNGRFFGGGMCALPKAELDDGMLDVVIMKKMNVLKLIVLMPGFIKGKHLSRKTTHYFRTNAVRFESDRVQDIECDGEVMPATPVEYKILPGALKVIV